MGYHEELYFNLFNLYNQLAGSDVHGKISENNSAQASLLAQDTYF